MISRSVFPVFGEKHKEYINSAIRSTISVAEGAVRAGKTIDNIAAFAALIQKGRRIEYILLQAQPLRMLSLTSARRMGTAWRIYSVGGVAGRNTRVTKL